jgi:hypothetical protein
MLSGHSLVTQAPVLDSSFLDFCPPFQDGGAAAVIDIGGRQIADAFMISAVVVMVDKALDFGFQVAGQEIVFQQDAVLQGLVPTLDLALGLGVVWRAADVVHALVFQPFGQITGDIRRAIVAEQAGLVGDRDLITARGFQRQGQGVGDVLGPYGRAQLPGDDIAGIVVQNGRQVEPAPADDLEIGEIGLPHLVGPGGLVAEFLGRLDHHEGRAGDQVMGLQQSVDRGFGDEIVPRQGFSHIPARPHHPVQDTQALEAHKKTSPHWSPP